MSKENNESEVGGLLGLLVLLILLTVIMYEFAKVVFE